MTISGGIGSDSLSDAACFERFSNHFPQAKQTAANASAKQMRSSQGPKPRQGQGPEPKTVSRSAAPLPRRNGFNFIYSSVVAGFEAECDPMQLRAIVSEVSIHALEFLHGCWHLSPCCS